MEPNKFLDIKKPTWFTNMVSRELQEAKRALKEHNTYENQVNVQRLQRELEKEAKIHRDAFRV